MQLMEFAHGSLLASFGKKIIARIAKIAIKPKKKEIKLKEK